MVLPFFNTISFLSGLNLSTPTPSECALFLLMRFLDPEVTSGLASLYKCKQLLALFVQSSLSNKLICRSVISDKDFSFFAQNSVKLR